MHYGYSADGTDCSFVCILLSPSLLSSIDRIKNSYIKPICNDANSPFFILDSNILWQRNFMDMLINIYNLCSEKCDGFELQAMSLFYSLLYSIYNNIKNNKIHLDNPTDKNLQAMHDMMGYIQQNYYNKITLGDIALAGNVCRSNCCKIFKLFSNRSPISYLTEYRLEKSMEMLNNTSYSMK